MNVPFMFTPRAVIKIRLLYDFQNFRYTEQCESCQLTLLPGSDTSRSSWMSVGYLACSALNIHYNNGSEVEAGGHDATDCVSKHTGCRNVDATNTLIITHREQNLGLKVCVPNK